MSEEKVLASRKQFLDIIAGDEALQKFLRQSNADIFAFADAQEADARQSILELWAADRATLTLVSASGTWRRLKSFSHGAVNSTFVGLFGNELKAAMYSRMWNIPHDAARAYFDAYDAALAQDEPWLTNTGLAAGIVSQLVVPVIAVTSKASAVAAAANTGARLSLKQVAEQTGSTLLVGPIHLVPTAATRIGNIGRFCAAETATFATTGAFLNRHDRYEAVDAAIDGGLLSGAIGCGIGALVPVKSIPR